MMWLLLYLIPLACCPLAFFWPGCACCPGVVDCTIGTSATLTDFTQNSGTWTQYGGAPAGVVTANSAATLTFNTANPDGTGLGVAVSTTAKSGTAGDKIRIFVDSPNASNYIALEVEIGSVGTAGYARLIRRATSIDTTVATKRIRFALPDAVMFMQLVYDAAGSIARCTVSNLLGTSEVLFQVGSVTTTNGSKAGFATNTVSPTGSGARFHAIVYEHYDATDCPDEYCTIHEDSTGDEEWNVVFGTWNGLTSTSAAAIVSSFEDFTASDNYKITVGSTGNGSGGIVFDYVDQQNHHAIKAGPSSTTRLYKRSGGVDTELYNFGAFPDWSIGVDGISVCVNGSSVVIDSTLVQRRVSTTLHGGTKFGFWADGAGQAFANYHFEVLKTCGEATLPRAACDSCGQCADSDSPSTPGARYQYELPDEFTLTISGVTLGSGGCPCASINGTYVVSHPEKLGGGGGTCGWDFPYPLAFPCDDGATPLSIHTDEINFSIGTAGGGVWSYTLTDAERCSLDSFNRTLTRTSGSVDGNGCDWSAAVVTLQATDTYAN